MQSLVAAYAQATTIVDESSARAAVTRSRPTDRRHQGEHDDDSVEPAHSHDRISSPPSVSSPCSSSVSANTRLLIEAGATSEGVPALRFRSFREDVVLAEFQARTSVMARAAVGCSACDLVLAPMPGSRQTLAFPGVIKPSAHITSIGQQPRGAAMTQRIGVN